MTVRFTVFSEHRPHEKTYNFCNVTKLVVIGDETTIGYHDDNGVYHEETNSTPMDITIINIGECAEKEQTVLTLTSKPNEEETK